VLAASKKNPRDSRAFASDIHNGRTVTVRLGCFQVPDVDEELRKVPSFIGGLQAEHGKWVAWQPDEGRAPGTYWHTPGLTWETPTQPVDVPTLVRGWYCPAHFLVDGFDFDLRLFAQNVATSGPPRLEITEVVTAGKNGGRLSPGDLRLPLGKLTDLVRIAARIAGVLYPFGYDGPGYGVVDGQLVELHDEEGKPRRTRTATAEQMAQVGRHTLTPALWGRDAVTAKELKRTRASGPRMDERDLRAADLADEPDAKGQMIDYVRAQLLAEGYTIGGRDNTKKAIQRGRQLRAKRSTKNTKKKGGKK